MLNRLFSRNTFTQPTRTADSLYDAALAAWNAADWPRAAALAREAVTAAPELAAPHYLLGSALIEQGELAAAQQAHEACIARKPGYPLVLNAELRAAQAWARRSLASGRAPRSRALDPRGRSISVIICSIRPERYAKASADFRAHLAEVEHEIIAIHDARSLCEGYNRAMRRARGDILIFSHDDVALAIPDFAARLLGHLQHYDVLGIAGTTRLASGACIRSSWPYIYGQIGKPGSEPGRVLVTAFHMRGATTPGAQAIDGVLLAARREAAVRIGWDENNFGGWHFYDFDFSYAAHLAGLRTAICHDLLVVHDSGGDFGEDWRRYGDKFREKYRETLPQIETDAPPALSPVETESYDEWRLMTEYMCARVP